MPTPSSTIGIIDLGLKELIKQKFASIMEIAGTDSDIVFFPKEIALREIAEKRAVGTVNFISIWNNLIAPDWKRRRTPLGRKGVSVGYATSGNTQLSVAKAVPVNLQYEITFWTTKLDTMLKVIEEYLYYPDDNPTLNMSFNGNNLNFQMEFGSIQDESTIREKYTKGVIYIFSCLMTLDGWLPRFDIDYTIKSIYTTLYDKNANPPIKISATLDTPEGTVSI